MSISELTIDQLGTVSRGRSRHRPRDAAFLYGGPYPFIQTGDVKRAGLYLRDYDQTYTEAGLAQSKLWPEGTLCITIAANIAETSILGIDACFPDSIIGFNAAPDKTDVRFVKYLFDATLKARFRSFTQGTTQDNLSQSKLLSIRFPVPNLIVQRKIADILSAYDDLIENNQRRIALLERMGREIYREWFVRLKFPGQEHRRIVDGIPKMWKKKTLGDVLSRLESGGRPTGGAQEEGIPSVGAENVIGIGQYDYTKEKFIPVEYFNSMRKGVIHSRDVVVYKDGANIGRSSYFGDGFPHEECAVNEHVFILRTLQEIGQNFLYFWVSEDETRQRIANLNANTAQPGVSQAKLKTLSFVQPPSEVTGQFNKGVEPLVRQIFLLAQVNQQLTEARDMLLPRLMSGEIPVRAASSILAHSPRKALLTELKRSGQSVPRRELPTVHQSVCKMTRLEARDHLRQT